MQVALQTKYLHFAEHCNTDIFIWCDGDVRTHTPMTLEFIHSIAPSENQLATYLGRRTWPECGWMMFNRNHPKFAEFMEAVALDLRER